MTPNVSRRGFLRGSVAGGALLGLGDVSFLSALGPVSAGESRLDPAVVRLRPEIEPLVRFIEETPRNRLLEEVAARIRQGLTYREILAALLLAGVRNIQPRPYVGFKFHSVLVVNSAHVASLSSPDEHRWLPIFWALDYFKSTQAQDVKEGDWTMAAVDESAVPPVGHARKAFQAAMDRWDEEAADAAVAGLARTAGAQEVYELFFRYGARDLRSIGHKAIFVANSWRTLACIGWQHAEPVLRSLAYALLNHRGEGNPSRGDLEADRPWKENLERVKKIRSDWRGGEAKPAAARELLETFREASPAEASQKVVEVLNRGVAPQSIWDALFAGAAELVMRMPGIVSLHAATTTNAVHFAYQTTGNDETSRLLLLQNAAFLALFREAARQRGGKPGGPRIDLLERAEPEKGGPAALEEIFADVSRDRMAAARKALTYLESGAAARELINAARVLIFLKGNDAHDYKYSSAVLEDYYSASPVVRNHFLAGSLFLLEGSGKPDNGLVKRTREAFRERRAF